MGTMKIMDASGHTTLKYELEDRKAVSRAEQVFKEKTDQGHAAFVKLEDGSFVRVNNSVFNPQADYILVAPVAGG